MIPGKQAIQHPVKIKPGNYGPGYPYSNSSLIQVLLVDRGTGPRGGQIMPIAF
jgi:hypothetical protein